MHRRAWLMILLSGLLVWSTTACTTLRVTSSGYPPPALPAASSPSALPAASSPPAPAPDTPADAAGAGLEMPVAPVAAPFPDAAGVTFAAYESAGDSRHGRPYQDGVLTQLWLEREGRRELVHRSDAATWSRIDLIPGHYVLEVVEIYDGEKSHPPNDDNVIEFDIQEGTSAQVGLVLERVPWAEIVIATLAVVVVVVVVAAIIAGIDELGKSRGSRGSGSSRSGSSRGTVRVPPPPRVPGGRTHVSVRGPRVWVPFEVSVIDLDPVVVWTPDLYRSMPPDRPRLSRIAMPAPDRPDGEIRLEFAQPMEPFYFDHETFRVSYEDGGPVAGGIYYDAAAQAAFFHPLRPLEPGRYRVTVYGEMLYSTHGTPLSANVEQSFVIGGEAPPPPLLDEEEPPRQEAPPPTGEELAPPAPLPP